MCIFEKAVNVTLLSPPSPTTYHSLSSAPPSFSPPHFPPARLLPRKTNTHRRHKLPHGKSVSPRGCARHGDNGDTTTSLQNTTGCTLGKTNIPVLPEFAWKPIQKPLTRRRFRTEHAQGSLCIRFPDGPAKDGQDYHYPSYTRKVAG